MKKCNSKYFVGIPENTLQVWVSQNSWLIMPLRILSKAETHHIANMVSILLAMSCTSYYFDSIVSNPMLAYISNFLLTPVYLADYLFIKLAGISIEGNSLRMFLVLWTSYIFITTRLSSFLIVKDYGVIELKNWYYNKNQVG